MIHSHKLYDKKSIYLLYGKYSFFIAFFVVVIYNKIRVKYTITILIIKEVSN